LGEVAGVVTAKGKADPRRDALIAVVEEWLALMMPSDETALAVLHSDRQSGRVPDERLALRKKPEKA
jgi:hypothetical protein